MRTWTEEAHRRNDPKGRQAMKRAPASENMASKARRRVEANKQQASAKGPGRNPLPGDPEGRVHETRAARPE